MENISQKTIEEIGQQFGVWIREVETQKKEIACLKAQIAELEAKDKKCKRDRKHFP